MIQNNTKLSINWSVAGMKCPEHGTKVKKIYSYGKYRDADVYTFKGCKCAVAQQHDPVGQYQYQPTYTTSFDDAAAIAKFSKAVQGATYN